MDNSSCSQITIQQKLLLIICGIFFCVIILEIGLRLGGFTFISMQEHKNRISIAKKGTYKIMCLGESTTVLWGKEAYPFQLEEILNQHNIGIKFSVINNGLSGTTTTNILARLENDFDKYKPNIVTAMIGINDREDPLADKNLFSNASILSFLSDFKTYKLAKLLWLHLIAKVSKPRDYLSMIELKRFHADQKIPIQAEEVLKKAIEQNPANEEAYLGLGLFYQKYELFSKAEEALKKAIEINPKNGEAYLVLGVLYDKLDFHMAEELFRKAIELEPTNEEAYAELGWLYEKQKMYQQAEELFKKAIGLNPRNETGYEGLGMVYGYQEKYSEAEELYKKAIELDHKSENSYEGLEQIYRRLKKYREAEELFKKAIELNPNSDWPYQYAIKFYNELGEHELAQKYLTKAQSLRLEYYNPVTRYNYRQIKKILNKKGIKLVCVQYPMRSIKPLEKIFEGEEGVIFVDNEKIFKNVINKTGYKEFFTDLFAGDFGHCTRKGNRFIAENIANAILKEIF